MTYSDDVLRLNPELAGHAAYRVKAERMLKTSDGFDSQLERDYYTELLDRKWSVQPHGWTFHLPGGVDYTPDFIAWSESGREAYVKTQYKILKRWTYVLKHVDRPIVYEVKGSNQARNARDSRTRFRIAAGLYPCFIFVWVTRNREGLWIEKVQA